MFVFQATRQKLGIEQDIEAVKKAFENMAVAASSTKSAERLVKNRLISSTRDFGPYRDADEAVLVPAGGKSFLLVYFKGGQPLGIPGQNGTFFTLRSDGKRFDDAPSQNVKTEDIEKARRAGLAVKLQ